jgi:hypothetical protein
MNIKWFSPQEQDQPFDKVRHHDILFRGLALACIAAVLVGFVALLPPSSSSYRPGSTISRGADNACADLGISLGKNDAEKQKAYDYCVSMQSSMDAERRKLQRR